MTLKRFQRHNSIKSSNLHVAEFTSGQIIAWIFFGLFAAALIFGLGIVVGRLDPSFENADKVGEAPPSPETQTYSVPAFSSESKDTPPPEPVETTKTKTSAQKTPEVAKPRSPFMDVSPQLTSMDPLPASRPKTIQVEAPSRTPRMEATEPTQADKKPEDDKANDSPAAAATSTTSGNNPLKVAAASQPASSTPSTPTSIPTPVEQQASSEQPTAASTETKKTPELAPISPVEPPLETVSPQVDPVQKTTTPVKGGYGIQLVAFSDPERQSHAAALQKKLLKDCGVTAEVIPSEDRLHYRVLVLGFSSKDSADKALTEIRTKTGFKDAFVRAL
jgi:hypothetical protein